MMKEIEVVCLPEEHENEEALKDIAAQQLKVPLTRIQAIKIRKRSIDARGRKVVYRMHLQVFMDAPAPPVNFNIDYPNVKDKSLSL